MPVVRYLLPPTTGGECQRVDNGCIFVGAAEAGEQEGIVIARAAGALATNVRARFGTEMPFPATLKAGAGVV